MSFDYPTETVTEGEAKVIVPKLEAYKEKPQDYAPSRAPVFYNPVMELNRDFAVLALQAYQKLLNRDLVVTSLDGCGLAGCKVRVEVTPRSRLCSTTLTSVR